MPAYLMAQIKMTRPEAWPAYRAAASPCVEKFGGRCLVSDVGPEVLEGSSDGRTLVLFEFPSAEAIRRFWASPDYAAVKTLREGAAELDVWVLPGA